MFAPPVEFGAGGIFARSQLACRNAHPPNRKLTAHSEALARQSALGKLHVCNFEQGTSAPDLRAPPRKFHSSFSPDEGETNFVIFCFPLGDVNSRSLLKFHLRLLHYLSSRKPHVALWPTFSLHFSSHQQTSIYRKILTKKQWREGQSIIHTDNHH